MKMLLFPLIAILFSSIAQAQVNHPSVKIGNQTWMVKNLDVDHYRNGDSIPEIKDSTEWSKLTTGAWCYYNNDPTMGAIYGKLYNWYAVNDPRGLAPPSWHIPSDSEWTTLETTLGGSLVGGDSDYVQVAGGKMKEAGTLHWLKPNIDGNNNSGWTGLQGGIRTISGPFVGVTIGSDWWSATEFSTTNASTRQLWYLWDVIKRRIFDKRGGLPVRCLRDTGVNTPANTGGKIPLIGQPYLGGILAYILQPGDPGYDAKVVHGLIAAKNDISENGKRKKLNWDEAKKYCTALGKGWILPNKDELNKLYKVKDKVGGFSSYYYWSSSEVGSRSAWIQAFHLGLQNIGGKDEGYYVRAVRAF